MAEELGWLVGGPEESSKAPDFSRLEHQWTLAQQALQIAGDYGRVPEAEYIYNLHLSVLKQRIKSSWAVLEEELPVSECVRLIEKMHADPPAALLGYAILITALNEAGSHVHAEAVADLQAAYRRGLANDGFFTPAGAEDSGAVGGTTAEAGPAPA